MKTLFPQNKFFAAFFGLLAASCFAALFLSGIPAQGGERVEAKKGDTYYTQFSLFQENNRHIATNYRRGELVPINTAVTFVKAGGNTIVVKLPTGTNLEIENVEKFTGEKINGIFQRTFGREKVDLAKFSKLEKENILAGMVTEDMSKDAVLKAIGFPPKHETHSLDDNQWRYWHHRYATFLVFFEGGKVTKIKG